MDFQPHRVILLKHVEALKATVATAFDFRLHLDLNLCSSFPESDYSAEARAVSAILREFPHLGVGCAYDTLARHGWDDSRALAALRQDPLYARRVIVQSVLQPREQPPVQGELVAFESWRQLRTAASILLLCVATICALELWILHCFVWSLGIVAKCALAARYLSMHALSLLRLFITEQIGIVASQHLCSVGAASLEQANQLLLILYRHGPTLAVPLVDVTVGFWNLPARYESSTARMAALCAQITQHEGGFWLRHQQECREMFADKEQAFVRTCHAATAFLAAAFLLRKLPSVANRLAAMVCAAGAMLAERWVLLAACVAGAAACAPAWAHDLTAQVERHAARRAGPGPSDAGGLVALAWVCAAVAVQLGGAVALWRLGAPLVSRFVWGY